jgi:predicted dehydrogenase
MNKLKRRSFIKSAFAVSTAPLILPSKVWSAPSEDLRIGFIGMGKMSRGLLQNALARGRVVAVSDVDTTRRDDAKSKVDAHYKNADCAMYPDFRDLIARKDIDVVFIATPDHWHAIQTLAALHAGKDVYCEKPLTHNIHEAITVMREAKATGRIVQTGSQQRSTQEFRVACELVQNGVIGKLTHVDCLFGGPAVPCDLPEEEMEPGLDWDLWLGPAPMRGYNSILSPRGIHKHFPQWRRYREYCNGMIGDWGAHHLDIVQWAMGMDSSGPVEVIPSEKAGQNHGAQLVYANGVKVYHKPGNGIWFFGTNGEIFVNRGEFVLNVSGETISDYRMTSKDGKRVPVNPETSCAAEVQKAVRTCLKDAKIKLYESRNHMANFFECVQSRQPPVADVEIGARTAICCHLLSQSYYHHAHLKWDPIKMVFTGGTGNPAWLTREYRGEWKV